MLPQLPHDLFDVIERDFGLQWTPGDRENLWHGLLDFKLERVKPAPWDLSEDEAKALLAASNAFRKSASMVEELAAQPRLRCVVDECGPEARVVAFALRTFASDADLRLQAATKKPGSQPQPMLDWMLFFLLPIFLRAGGKGVHVDKATGIPKCRFIDFAAACFNAAALDPDGLDKTLRVSALQSRWRRISCAKERVVSFRGRRNFLSTFPTKNWKARL